MVNAVGQVPERVEVSYGREGVADAGARLRSHRKNVHVREGHLLFLRRPKLEEGGERISLRL